MSVVIDYVVEDELECFIDSFRDLNLNINIKYYVLIAEPEIVTNRLSTRGSNDLIERSLFLLDRLKNTIINKSCLYDTSQKTPEEVVTFIINENNSFVSLQIEPSK